MKKIYSFVMALCVVLCANATPLQGLAKKGYQLLPSVAELATGIEKAPAATQGLQYDATAAINVTYNSADMLVVTTDYISQGQVYIDVIAADYSSSTSLLLFAKALDENGNVPAGTYPISSTPAYGTAYASQGYDAQLGATPCAYFPLVVKEDGIYITTPMFFMVSGNVTVEYVDGNMKLTIDAVNSNGVAGQVVYDPNAEVAGLQYDEQTGSVDRTYTAEDMLMVDTTYIAQYNLGVDILAADQSDVLSLWFFVPAADPEIGLPEGTYPIASTPALNTALASEGVDAEGYLTPSYYATLTPYQGQLAPNKLWFLVSGQIVVEKVNGKMKLTVDAVNSYNVPVHVVYDPTSTAVENTVVENNNVQKLIKNNQLLIIKEGVEYNVLGSVVK